MGRAKPNNWADPSPDGQMDTAADGQIDMSVDGPLQVFMVPDEPDEAEPVHGYGYLDSRFGELLEQNARPWPGGARNVAVDTDLFDRLSAWCAEHGVAKRVAMNWLLREFVGEEVQ